MNERPLQPPIGLGSGVHAALVQCLWWILPALLLVVMRTADSFVTVFMFWALGALVLLALFYLAPVRCVRSDCGGRMQYSLTRISFWKMRLHYRCEACRAERDADIFAPDIQIEVSG